MLASCQNCCFGSGKKCELGLRPQDGDVLCNRYAMSVSFREDLLGALRTDVQDEINQAMLMVNQRDTQQAEAFAG